MNLLERFKAIKSPYDNLQGQIDRAFDELLWAKTNKDIDKYDLSQMSPKVTYDDFIICLYCIDNKLYKFDDEGISEVEIVDILEFNIDFEAVNHNGSIMNDDDLLDYCEYDNCGESDDLSCYVYFKDK